MESNGTQSNRDPLLDRRTLLLGATVLGSAAALGIAAPARAAAPSFAEEGGRLHMFYEAGRRGNTNIAVARAS